MITVTPTSVTLANSAQTVVTGTDGVGDNTATWDPTVAVTVPATAAAGTYTGTLTHSIDPSVTITFTVVPATPSITTSQQPATAAVGSSIADQATVTGDNPTGTATFNLYNNPNGTGTPLFTDTENLVGGVATSAGFTPTATGTVYWVATYNGDINNNPVTSGLAGEPVTVTPAAVARLAVSSARQRQRRHALERHGQRRGHVEQRRHHLPRDGALHHHRYRLGRGAAGGLHLQRRRQRHPHLQWRRLGHGKTVTLPIPPPTRSTALRGRSR